jgi:putative SOS response-associated peptidase YedK
MRWQLVPQWEPAFKTKLSTINARCEGIFASELYRNLVIRQRCVIPLSGFYEWKRAPSRNRPYKVYRHDGEIMSVGGVWDVWHPGRPDEHHSFSIITTPANNRIGTIHNRMPLILDRAGVEEWVDPEVQERDPLQRLMKPCPDSWLETVEVSTLVNSPKNNSPEVLAPLQAPLSQER